MVTIRSVKTGRSSGCLDGYTQTKLVARHGACLNFTWDEVVVAKKSENGQDTKLFAFYEGHRKRIAIDGQRPT